MAKAKKADAEPEQLDRLRRWLYPGSVADGDGVTHADADRVIRRDDVAWIVAEYSKLRTRWDKALGTAPEVIASDILVKLTCAGIASGNNPADAIAIARTAVEMLTAGSAQRLPGIE